uniref:Integrin alpha first immunoglubulin-like domain-containing protein n=1 Tax=Anabas testudineus TaxID=64144 RepID=A0A7N6AN78_ANATE
YLLQQRRLGQSAASMCWRYCWILVQVLGLVYLAAGYNLDEEHSLEFSGQASSMFGYSVLLNRHGHHRCLCVCVRAEMPLDCGKKTCEAENDEQWLGVSLSRQPEHSGGQILACAHLWKNVYYLSKDRQNNKLPHGVCYLYNNDLTHSQYMIPCYKDHQRKFGEDYGSCQAGISNFLTEDLIIMGAPGTSYWTGSVLVFNTSSGGSSVYLDDDSGAVGFGSYLGYSVGAGHFLGPATVEVVGGAPQYKQKGKVFIFTLENTMLQIASEVSGRELGSYFGSSLCAVDLNADGLSDLLVGAPMATGLTREEGRVHVYINQGQAKLLEAEFQLSGSDAYAARFGETIADLGDLDDDGYNDVAIGAPQEDDLKGAVYIYNGRKEGISPTPSQRITGSTLGYNLRMFGQSLSSGVDIDDNGYQDVAVGAFLSDSAVVLRTRPVIQVKAFLMLPEQIDQRVTLCQEHKTPTVCFNVTVCFSVRSRQFNGAIDLQYNLTSDLFHKPSFPHRFYFHGNGSSNSTRGRVKARHGQLTCASHLVYQRVTNSHMDIFTPVHFEASYGLRETNPRRAAKKIFPPLKPILQQKPGHQNTITNQVQNSANINHIAAVQANAKYQQLYFSLGSGDTIMLKTSLLNSGDDAFLPRLTLRFPDSVQYIKVLQNVSASNSTMVEVDCSVTSLLLPAGSQVSLSQTICENILH